MFGDNLSDYPVLLRMSNKTSALRMSNPRGMLSLFPQLTIPPLRSEDKRR